MMVAKKPVSKGGKATKKRAVAKVKTKAKR